MPDREKVIKDLESFVGICSTKWSPHRIDESWKELQHLLADALAMLKEQEAVKRKISPEGVRCGKCDRRLRYDSEFCDKCGKAVKLE